MQASEGEESQLCTPIACQQVPWREGTQMPDGFHTQESWITDNRTFLRICATLY